MAASLVDLPRDPGFLQKAGPVLDLYAGRWERQETLLAAWRGLEGFEGRSSVRAWLYQIATNRALDDSGRPDGAQRTRSA